MVLGAKRAWIRVAVLLCLCETLQGLWSLANKLQCIFRQVRYAASVLNQQWLRYVAYLYLDNQSFFAFSLRWSNLFFHAVFAGLCQRGR
jgi:hypothetical protein